MTRARQLRRRIGLLGLGAMVAIVAVVAPALGYIGQAPVQVGVSGPPGDVSCLDQVTLTASVVDTSTGSPVAEQVVTWELTDGIAPGDALSGTSSVTDAQGQASIVLSFGQQTGAREVTASVTIVATPIRVRCDVGLPQTALDPPGVDIGALDPPAHAAEQDLPALDVRIPRLGVDAPIVEGDGTDVPADAVAHHPGTAWPGEGSNSYLYGHARDGLFRELWQVRTGDLVEVRLAGGGLARYRVSQIRPLVAWDDLSVLQPTDGERLTLQTCLWYDRTSPRFVVIAEPVTGAP
jgi:LPXTG-site transpeptidase (sortase) family protein